MELQKRKIQFSAAIDQIRTCTNLKKDSACATQYSELYLPDRSEAGPLLAVNDDRLSIFNPDLLSHVGGLGVPLPVLLLLVNRQVLTAATAKQGLKSHTKKALN